jgi:cell wall-associated NlpC family hydrolase
MKRRNPKWAYRRLHMAPHGVDMQTGPDVRALQHAINQRCKALGLHGIKVDGECGRHTIAKGRQVATALGIVLKHPGLTRYAQHLIRHPKQRNPFQKRRSKKWRAENVDPPSPKVAGNSVSGGSVRERIVAAAMEAARLYYTGKSHRFYSQPGTWTVEKGITGESPGQRSDCSQFVTSLYHSADAPDPNGANYTGGWTGSLEAHCQEISRGALKPGDLVIYGPRGATHHVEEWVGNGDGRTSYATLAKQGSQSRDRTVGHGSPPVDYGDIDMISGPRFFRAPGLD